MTQFSHRVLVKGHYQIVAMSPGAHYDPDHITRYGLTTVSGAWLRRDLCLDDARACLEQLLDSDAIATPSPAPRSKRGLACR